MGAEQPGYQRRHYVTAVLKLTISAAGTALAIASAASILTAPPPPAELIKIYAHYDPAGQVPPSLKRALARSPKADKFPDFELVEVAAVPLPREAREKRLIVLEARKKRLHRRAVRLKRKVRRYRNSKRCRKRSYWSRKRKRCMCRKRGCTRR